MYYRIAALKKDDNQREVTIRANSREEVKEQMERIKAFLFPGEDTTNYFYQMAEFRELVNNTIHMSFFRVFVCRPVKPDKKTVFQVKNNRVSIPNLQVCYEHSICVATQKLIEAKSESQPI